MKWHVQLPYLHQLFTYNSLLTPCYHETCNSHSLHICGVYNTYMQTELKYMARFPESLYVWSETRKRLQSEFSASTIFAENSVQIVKRIQWLNINDVVSVHLNLPSVNKTKAWTKKLSQCLPCTVNLPIFCGHSGHPAPPIFTMHM